jgi:hypothetical protein
VKHRIIWESEDQTYRILEILDSHADMDSLKGDCFNTKVNSDIDPEKLREEEKHFEEFVEREGVFGYVLEHWNPAVGVGYEHVDSCWGFVGAYTPTEETFNHYIVDELKATATNELKKAGGE